MDDPEDDDHGPVDPVDGRVVADPEAVGQGFEPLELLDGVASREGAVLELAELLQDAWGRVGRERLEVLDDLG
ncbi:MAG TPA: hypothetical protein VJM10_05020 [Candidatus Methylomirabilis sp.]|nr:hypothetical protein [Candidatus Methylomirabilis sp.]